MAKPTQDEWVKAMTDLLNLSRHDAGCKAWFLQSYRLVVAFEKNCSCAIGAARALLEKASKP